MDLTVIDDASLLRMYSDAVQAMSSLMTGRREASVSVSQGAGNRSVSYTQATVPDLRAWLALLLAAITARGLLAQQPRTRRAIGIRF